VNAAVKYSLFVVRIHGKYDFTLGKIKRF